MTETKNETKITMLTIKEAAALVDGHVAVINVRLSAGNPVSLVIWCCCRQANINRKDEKYGVH